MVCIKSTVEARSHRTGAEECHDDVISQFAFELRIKAKEEEVGKSFHDPFKGILNRRI